VLAVSLWRVEPSSGARERKSSSDGVPPLALPTK
jgi:hypothetical protein